ncbi:MAG: PadR family transcriptional regulator [Halieaceae bacterium]|jgi:DNA-binding PadR family transcriptional regulator|nr:PadR family transcriptional regulator [Halieaceae bacterium]
MALNHAIMTAMLDTPTTGYELTKRFDTSLGFFWKASHQQIYKALRDLEQQGLLFSEDVPQAGKPDKVVYQLTEQGRQHLDAWVLQDSQVREAKDDLFVKLYNLNAHNRAHLRQELEKRAHSSAEKLSLYHRIRNRRFANPANLPLREQGIYCALLAGIRHCEMTLDWVEEVTPLIGDA